MPKIKKKIVKKAIKVERAVKVKAKPITLKRKKDLLVKALTDPKFRTQLAKSPAKVFGVTKLTTKDQTIVKETLAKIEQLEGQIAALADELLCACQADCGVF